MLRVMVGGLCLVLLAVGLLGPTAMAEPQNKKKDKGAPGKSRIDPDKEDNLKGRARWDWTLGKGKRAETGTFQGDVNGKVYHGMKQIGTFTREAKKWVKVNFTAGPLKGTADLRLTVVKPATYEGELAQKGGKKERLVLVIRND